MRNLNILDRELAIRNAADHHGYRKNVPRNVFAVRIVDWIIRIRGVLMKSWCTKCHKNWLGQNNFCTTTFSYGLHNQSPFHSFYTPASTAQEPTITSMMYIPPLTVQISSPSALLIISALSTIIKRADIITLLHIVAPKHPVWG